MKSMVLEFDDPENLEVRQSYLLLPHSGCSQGTVVVRAECVVCHLAGKKTYLQLTSSGLPASTSS